MRAAITELSKETPLLMCHGTADNDARGGYAVLDLRLDQLLD